MVIVDELGESVTAERIAALRSHYSFLSDSVSREVGLVLDALVAENARQLRALQTIRDRYGKVCASYELPCGHDACDSSVGAWMEANAALKGVTSHDD